MPKRPLVKATAVLVCIVFLFLVFPGKADARTRTQKPDFNRIFKKPVIFVVNLLSYVPIWDLGRDFDRSDRTKKKINGRMKIAGTLPSLRVSGGDQN